MKYHRYLIGIALAVVIAMVAVGAAQHTRQGGRNPGGGGQGGDFGILGALHSITLTSEQETQIKQIFKTNEPQIEAVATASFEARCAYSKGVISSASDLPTLAQNLATAQANRTALETTILGDVTKVLTSEQIATIAASSCTPPSK
jgi:Spy/CpxP family protein refolding chaperone